MERDFLTELDNPFPVTRGMRENFQRDGFIKVKGVLTEEEIGMLEPAVTGLVEEFRKGAGADGGGGYALKPFVQLFGLWRRSEVVRRFTLSKRLAKMAADLMGVQGVRLYMDQSFYKLPGGSETVPHQDLSYWPIATENACAVWIPLMPVPLGMGPLGFYRGSHRIGYRPQSANAEGEDKIGEELDSRGCEAVIEAFELGEASFHYGWTFHMAQPNRSGSARKVHTVNYFEDGTRLAPPSPHQVSDWKTVCPEVQPGQVIDTPLTPVLWKS